MGLLSASNSITRYTVEGRLKKPVLETVAAGLKKNMISEIDDNASEKAVGWTSFDKPYQPDFGGSNYVYGAYLVFALRIDKKTIPSKVIIKDLVIDRLNLKVPATPNVYDIVWNYEDSVLWFFSNLKAANEEVETLFLRSFDLSLIRVIPYTAAHLDSGLTDTEKDLLLKLTPINFAESAKI